MLVKKGFGRTDTLFGESVLQGVFTAVGVFTFVYLMGVLLS